MFSGNMIGQVLGLISIPVVTRIYAPELYGEYSMYLQLVIATSILLSFRYEHLLILSSSHKAAVNNLKSIMMIALVASLILPIFILSNKNLVEQYYSVKLDNYLILILVFSGLLTCLSYGLEQNLQKKEVFFRSTLGDVFSKVVFFIFAVICAYSSLKEYGLLLSLMLGLSIKVIYLLWISKFDVLAGKQRFSFKELKGLSKRSLALVYSHLLLVSTQLLPLQYVAANFGKNTLGQFSLSLATLSLVVLLGSQPMSKVYFQRMSKTNTNQERLDLWNQTIKLAIMISSPVFIVIYFTSDWGYQFVFGENWNEAGSLAKILLFSSYFAFISRPMESTSLALNIWWYSPLWHSLRVFSMYLLFEYLEKNDIQLEQSLEYFVYLLIIVYIIDIVVQRTFLKRNHEEKNYKRIIN
ncbi:MULTISPECIES: lipopolysaccharide biosynthesis protein [unclassified Colwellia]|nr:oligosaccharide flippase family protein [Colwellia sp. MB3u-41]